MIAGTTLRSLERLGIVRVEHGDPGTEVRGVRHDSRAVVPGDLFGALPGSSGRDGNTFIGDAIARGATAVLTTHRTDHKVPQVVAKDVRLAFAKSAEVVYGSPTSRLAVVGITGTNGKTTITFLVEAAILAAGGRPGLVGTVAQRGPGFDERATLTTPEADELARIAARVARAGGTHLVMEASSHALELRRVDGIRFDVAAFTNLTQDHLDFHGTMEAYFAAKARLFTELAPRASVVHIGDEFGRALAARLGPSAITVSTAAESPATIRVLESTLSATGTAARIATPAGVVAIDSPLVGAYNLENIVVALGCAHALDLPMEAAARGIASSAGAPGRLERISSSVGVDVLVDYAHTPDALARALTAARTNLAGRLFVVFGCGGDRDRGKRPQMALAAANVADVVVVTSDNPRTELPSRIIEDALEGLRGVAIGRLDASELASAARGYFVCEDRAAAIEAAIRAARAGDRVVVAGKGHENYQIIGTVTRPFDDREVARRVLGDRARLGVVVGALGGGARR